MKTTQFEKIEKNKVKKEIEIEGLPKERIEVFLRKGEDKDLEYVCSFFGRGKLMLVWESKEVSEE